MEITGIRFEKQGENQQHVVISTDGGNIECIFHDANGKRGVIWLCGALGGFDGPSFGIFKLLSEHMVSDGISSLRLHYRYPGEFDECVQDVLIGIKFLNEKGIDCIALVGHSFGGAVAIQAGTLSNSVKAVIGLSSQTAGARNVARLSPRPLLLIHGERDRNLSYECSELIYKWAREPKELKILKNNGHFLREAHVDLLIWIRDWLLDKLGSSSMHQERTPLS
jgi:alpha/beta superfamily hydrolase